MNPAKESGICGQIPTLDGTNISPVLRVRAEREKVRASLSFMSTLRRSFSCLVLCALAPLAGCQVLSSDYWQGPSVLGKAPPDPPKLAKREPQGGFSVVVDAPGQPTAARAIADIGAFAQRRGFVRVGGSSGAERYVAGKMALDIALRSTDSHVVAALHGPGLSRKFAENFYHDFDREYGRRYGEEDPVFETDFLSD